MGESAKCPCGMPSFLKEDTQQSTLLNKTHSQSGAVHVTFARCLIRFGVMLRVRVVPADVGRPHASPEF